MGTNLYLDANPYARGHFFSLWIGWVFVWYRSYKRSVNVSLNSGIKTKYESLVPQKRLRKPWQIVEHTSLMLVTEGADNKQRKK